MERREVLPCRPERSTEAGVPLDCVHPQAFEREMVCLVAERVGEGPLKFQGLREPALGRPMLEAWIVQLAAA